MIVAINKIDLPGANVPKVKQDLLQHNVVLEEFGGNVLSAEISAKKGTGVDELLEQILLQAEILDLKANPDGKAQGTGGRGAARSGQGPVATILVQNGTLRVGDDFICGMFSGRVRALLDERGKTVKEAGPSIPVQILGFEGVPVAGDSFAVVDDAVEAREIAQKRQRLEREAQSRRTARGRHARGLQPRAQGGRGRHAPDRHQGRPGRSGGSAGRRAGAARHRRGPGRGRPPRRRRHHRERHPARQGVRRDHPRLPRAPRLQRARGGGARGGRHPALPHHLRGGGGRARRARGHAQAGGARDRAGRGRSAAALQGQQGRHHRRLHGAQRHHPAHRRRRGSSATAWRSTPARCRSLKRFKDDVREVREGFECGIGIENFNDLKVGDLIESYRMEEVKRTLSASARRRRHRLRPVADSSALCSSPSRPGIFTSPTATPSRRSGGCSSR